MKQLLTIGFALFATAVTVFAAYCAWGYSIGGQYWTMHFLP